MCSRSDLRAVTLARQGSGKLVVFPFGGARRLAVDREAPYRRS